MPVPPLPPLRVRETDGSPNVIPVFEIVLSNDTLTDLGGGRVAIGGGGGTAQEPITFPLITGSGGTSISYVGSGGMVLGVPTGGGTVLEYKVLTAGANMTITHAGSTMTFAATTGAASTGLATTAELYIVVANTDSLSSERALTAGLGIAIADSGAGAGIYVQAATPFLVSSNRTLTAVYPVLSGGNLGADRSFHVDTAFLVSSNRQILTTAPVAGGGNLSADRTITVDTAYLIGSGRTINTTYPLAGGGNLSADRTFIVTTGGVGTMLTTSGGVTGDIAWVATAGPVTIRMPLALMTVQPDSANTFWRTNTLPLLDVAYVGFVDGGEGIATYWGIAPFNLHTTPSWTLFAYHVPDGGAGGNALVSVRAAAVTHAETAAYTLLSSAAVLATQANTTMAITQVSGASFDSVVALSAGDFVFVEVNRHGANASDTVGDQWNLLSLALQCRVN